MRVVWASRHKPLPAELHEIKRLFPNAELIYLHAKIPNAEWLLEFTTKVGASAVVAILPLSFLYRFVELANRHNITVVIPKMKELYRGYSLQEAKKLVEEAPDRRVVQQYDASGEVAVYEFERFERVVRIDVVTEPL